MTRIALNRQGGIDGRRNEIAVPGAPSRARLNIVVARKPASRGAYRHHRIALQIRSGNASKERSRRDNPRGPEDSGGSCVRSKSNHATSRGVIASSNRRLNQQTTSVAEACGFSRICSHNALNTGSSLTRSPHAHQPHRPSHDYLRGDTRAGRTDSLAGCIVMPPAGPLRHMARRGIDFGCVGWMTNRRMVFHLWQGGHHGQHHSISEAPSCAGLGRFARRQARKRLRGDTGGGHPIRTENRCPPVRRDTVPLPPLRNCGSTGAYIGRHGLARGPEFDD